MPELWARVGISFRLMEEEIHTILSTNPGQHNMKCIIAAAFTEGRFELDGETYIPEASIEDINKKHNTSYDVCEYECSF